MINENMLQKLMGNKKVQKLLGNMSETAALLMSFAQTYLGVYNEKGEQLEKGDRDYLFEALERIEKRLEEIEKKLS